ncbi:MAG: nucleoside hydrolase [Caldilineaceae bacterium]|nr:nucleoside hydrolase [Caldilineaceae bacterium]
MPKKIIIDTDPGIDDAMAILFALCMPALEVVGLTTIFGNVETPLATHNALHLLAFAGHSQIPVAQGAIRPLHLPFRGPAAFVHGVDGLGDTKQPAAPQGQALAHSAAHFIIEQVMAQPGEITLVPVGPLTNLALALLLEPQIVHHVAEVVIMGGAATVNGNVNPAAEANIYHDPHAADAVFTADWPITMVGLDVTTKVIMDEPYLASLCTPACKTGAYIYDICQFYLDFHQRVHQTYAAYTHDPSAIAYLIDPTLFHTEQGAIRVVTEGLGRGHTVMDRRGHWSRPNEWSTQRPVNVCVDVNAAGLLALYKQSILAAP